MYALVTLGDIISMRPQESKSMTCLSRRTLVSLLVSAAFAQEQTPPAADQQWKKFLDWFSALPPESFHTGAELVALYRAQLTRDGVSPAEFDKILAVIRERTSDAEFNKIFWNKHFERTDPQFNTQPNAFLVEVASKLTPGRALDLGMGEGRNSIYLAQHGWDVTGVDYAEAGVAKARKRAESLGLKINAIVQDADQFEFGAARWDLVCLLYAPGDGEVRDFAKRLTASLKPGGYVLSEGPYQTPKTLADQWTAWTSAGLKLLRLEYHEEKSDWGQPNFGRTLFRKP
jgi:SAM-dependent methyltransferase